MSEIFNLQEHQGANVIETSRFIPEIVSIFEGSEILEISASKEDVKRYLEGHIDQLPSFVCRSLKLKEEIISTISEAADRMFLLAQIYFDFLNGMPTIKAIKLALRDFREQNRQSGEDKKIQALTDAYGKVMERINGQKPVLKDLAIRVLLWITCAKKPLTLLELQHVLAVGVGEPGLDGENILEVDEIVSVCAGLVIIDEGNNIARLVHYTTQEYFEKTQSQWFPEAQLAITRVCTTYLCFDVFGSGCSQSYEELKQRFKSNLFFHYASHYWGYHACADADRTFPDVVSFLAERAQVEASAQGLLRDQPSTGNISIIAKRGVTGPHLAAYFGLEKVMSVIIDDCDPNATDSDGWTPVLWAIQERRKDITQLLSRAEANSDPPNENFRKELLSMTSSRVQQVLVERTSTKVPYDAVERGRENVICMLLKHDADTDGTPDRGGNTPLIIEAARYGSEIIVQLFLHKGANIETRDNTGQTALMIAVSCPHEGVAKVANIEAENALGETPLIVAVKTNQESMVNLLLDKGALMESKNKNGRQHY
ncbi:hypothetical protein AAE478_004995 [Parahypoxylon ruwenzoriense]